jgi:hypothetical protein
MNAINFGKFSVAELTEINSLLDQNQLDNVLALIGWTKEDLEDYKARGEKSNLVNQIMSKIIN